MVNVFFNDEVLAAEKKIYTSLQVPAIILMENAGANSAKKILNKITNIHNNKVIIITGKGNNAGDGFVVARHLSNSNFDVKILMLYPEKELKNDALINYSILKNSRNKYIDILYCKDYKAVKKETTDSNFIIIDAIFGVGFKGKMDKRIEDVIKFVNQLKEQYIISLDVPSGLYFYNQDEVCIKANETLTMGVKKFHTLFYKGKENSGKTEIMNIGISKDEFTNQNFKNIFEIEENDIKKIIPQREINSNKYSNGKVFILSGSKGLTGAAYLCSQSAMQTGSGAVVTGIPQSLNEIMEIKLTEVMTLSLSETENSTLSLKCYDEIKSRLKWADTILIGPGLSKNEETMELVRKIVIENDLNFVIDADAISAFKGKLNYLKKRKIILTPHLGEFSNLTGRKTEEVKSNFYELSKNFAKEYKVILVLKNSPTIITDGENFFINSTGKENLATSGTGDVLSGIIAGIYSQTGNALNSAVTAVYIHGKCGDNLYECTGSSSMLASDMIDEISVVKNQLS
ncbi:MAG: NAD(P)H-hydrate dehydratase [Bacteroidota bacterium]|nr:NAD(P)H-hydrate dehydratase [Bacteroidota bacterium]